MITGRNMLETFNVNILEYVCFPSKGEDGNVIMLMLTINDPEIHKII